MRLRSGHSTAPTAMKEGELHEAKTQTIRIGSLRVNRVIAVVHFNIFLYSTCFWIQQGVFPYLSSKLETSTVIYGYLQTTFAVVQLAGGPIFGRFGDLYGGRAALTLAFISAAVSYGILGFADSIAMLFASRLPSLCMHAMQGGQMVVTDLADSTQRVGALGKLAISYGVGMVVGPILGGLLAHLVGLQEAAFIACVGSLFSVFVCQVALPSQTKKSHTAASQQEKSGAAVFSLNKFATILKNEKAFTLLVVRFVTGVPIGIFQSMFSVVAMETYGLDAAQNGYIMSYIGILSMLVQGLGMGFLNSRFSEMQLIRGAVFILIFAYTALMYVTGVWQLCVVLAPLVFGLAVLTIVISAALTNSVPDQDTGAILGINMAVNSLVRTVSPTVGGILLSVYGFSSFGFLGCVQSTLMTIYLAWRARNGTRTYEPVENDTERNDL